MVKIIEDSIIPLEEIENKEILDLIGEDKIKKYDKYIHLINFCGYINKNTLAIPKKIKEFLDKENKEGKDFKEYFDLFFEKFLLYILRELSKEKILFSISLADFPVDEYKPADSKIFKLLLLLETKEEIINSIHLILVNPHRKLVNVEEFKNLDEVDELDENILISILTNPQFLYKTKGLNGEVFPSKVLQYEKLESLDTLENRFVKHFLKEINEFLSNEDDFIEKIEGLKILKNEIDFALQSDIFTEIKDLDYFPSNSQVLMKKAGYRELFQIYRLFHMSFIPKIFKNLDLAFSLKDLATLWEYYVLIHLLRELNNIYGEYKIKVNFEEKSKFKYEDAEFEFDNRIKFYYQKTLKSYSCLPFRPDFLIEKDGKKYIFDAKFRIFENNKKDILENMHYYKDSLNAEFSVAVCFGKSLENNKVGEFFSKSNYSLKKFSCNKIKKNRNKELKKRGSKVSLKELIKNFGKIFHGVGYIDLILNEERGK